jgi:hypothetical protein
MAHFYVRHSLFINLVSFCPPDFLSLSIYPFISFLPLLLPPFFFHALPTYPLFYSLSLHSTLFSISLFSVVKFLEINTQVPPINKWRYCSEHNAQRNFQSPEYSVCRSKRVDQIMSLQEDDKRHNSIRSFTLKVVLSPIYFTVLKYPVCTHMVWPRPVIYMPSITA